MQELPESDGDNQVTSADWLNEINHGGLFCISNTTFDFFVSLEYEVHICKGHELSNLCSDVQQSEDVLFHRAMITATLQDNDLAAN